METNLAQQPVPGLRRIVLYGPESTGKTTLARQLAAHFDTLWVPEYMRTYYEKKWKGKQGVSQKTDLLPIAQGQMKWENERAPQASTYLFCDTNLLEIQTYAQLYFDGFCPDEIQTYARSNHYDFYLLTYVDIPWEADPLRDKPEQRAQVFGLFEKALQNIGQPYKILRGSKEARLQKAVQTVEALFDY